MQLEEFGHEQYAEGHRGSEIFSGVWIEQSILLAHLAIEENIDGLIGLFSTANVDHRVSGVGASCGRLQLFIGESGPGLDYRDRFGRCRPVEFIAVNDNATGRADHEDVQANTDSAPEMNLKDGLAQPHVLRTGNPLPPMSHAFAFRCIISAHCIARTAGAEVCVRGNTI